MSPATATAAGGIHLHMAGKVGQKAVGTTIIFGAEGVNNLAPPLTASCCFTRQYIQAGREPIPLLGASGVMTTRGHGIITCRPQEALQGQRHYQPCLLANMR